MISDVIGGARGTRVQREEEVLYLFAQGGIPNESQKQKSEEGCEENCLRVFEQLCRGAGSGTLTQLAGRERAGRERDPSCDFSLSLPFLLFLQATSTSSHVLSTCQTFKQAERRSRREGFLEASTRVHGAE